MASPRLQGARSDFSQRGREVGHPGTGAEARVDCGCLTRRWKRRSSTVLHTFTVEHTFSSSQQSASERAAPLEVSYRGVACRAASLALTAGHSVSRMLK